MASIGLYFRGLNKREANSLRSRLNEIAAGFGYTAEAGPTAGQGNAAALLMAIDAGEIALVLLPDEQRDLVMQWLDNATNTIVKSGSIHDAMKTIYDAIDASVQRERVADWREIEEMTE